VYIYYTKITHSCAKLEHINQLKLFNKVIMGKMKKLVGKLSLSQKGGASPLGVACAVCFMPVMAINKPDFLADIENNRDLR
jgi:hypothetical protein